MNILTKIAEEIHRNNICDYDPTQNRGQVFLGKIKPTINEQIVLYYKSDETQVLGFGGIRGQMTGKVEILSLGASYNVANDNLNRCILALNNKELVLEDKRVHLICTNEQEDTELEDNPNICIKADLKIIFK